MSHSAEFSQAWEEGVELFVYGSYKSLQRASLKYCTGSHKDSESQRKLPDKQRGKHCLL